MSNGIHLKRASVENVAFNFAVDEKPLHYSLVFIRGLSPRPDFRNKSFHVTVKLIM